MSADKRIWWSWWVACGVLCAGVLALVLSFLLRPGDRGPQPSKFTNDLGMEFVLITKGRFWSRSRGIVDEPPVREVAIPHDFYLGMHEVTQDEWHRVMGKNPSSFSRIGRAKGAVQAIPDEELKRFPVDSVSWDDCQEFVTRLNEKLPEKDWVYRLPSEAEWEYACRYGPLSKKEDDDFVYFFESPTNGRWLGKANFGGGEELQRPRPCKVGSYPANRLGLHDMHGNVWEWCDDVLDEKSGLEGVTLRAKRGGGWNTLPDGCQVTSRYRSLQNERDEQTGLRLARVYRR